MVTTTTITGSDRLTTATCPRCGKCHAIPIVRLVEGHVLNKALCPGCHCEQQRREQAEAQRMRREALEAAWQAICPPLYRRTDRARLPQEQLGQILAWQYGPKGLLLLGPTGSGKTRAAYLLLRQQLETGRKITAFDCARFGHECGRRFRDGTGEAWADGLAKVELVFLDDLGKVPFTERVEAELFALVERRAANELPTIATSNVTGADLEAKASPDRGAPMVRRLREFSQCVVFPPGPHARAPVAGRESGIRVGMTLAGGQGGAQGVDDEEQTSETE